MVGSGTCSSIRARQQLPPASPRWQPPMDPPRAAPPPGYRLSRSMPRPVRSRFPTWTTLDAGAPGSVPSCTGRPARCRRKGADARQRSTTSTVTMNGEGGVTNPPMRLQGRKETEGSAYVAADGTHQDQYPQVSPGGPRSGRTSREGARKTAGHREAQEEHGGQYPLRPWPGAAKMAIAPARLAHALMRPAPSARDRSR